mgnify:CR=1 FL=1|tara:strand:- start:2730 stop:3338 length:609 start_codon:yes stop_codon:yes gene_type:complete
MNCINTYHRATQAVGQMAPVRPTVTRPDGPRCTDCLTNQLMYWNSFWTTKALPGHEEEYESVIALAAGWRTRERGATVGSPHAPQYTSQPQQQNVTTQEDDMASAAPTEKHKRTQFDVGVEVVGTYKDHEYRGQMIDGKDGARPVFKITKGGPGKATKDRHAHGAVDDKATINEGETFRSPSAAASIIVGYAVTGYLFWTTA